MALPRTNFLIRANPDARRASEELQNLGSQLSPWVGGDVRIVGRSGSPGFDQLTRSELGIEASSVFGDSARVTVITKPIFLRDFCNQIRSFLESTKASERPDTFASFELGHFTQPT